MNHIKDSLPSLLVLREVRGEVCQTHGQYDSRNIIFDRWSHCPACEADRAAAAKAEHEEAVRREKLVRWQNKIGQSGIPDRFLDRTIGSFVADSPEKGDAIDFATAYADDFASIVKTGRSAMFIGQAGTGKTHLAAGIGISVMGDGYSVLFSTVMRAIRRVKDTWSRGSAESETQAIAALVSPDLLILDEVGVQFGSETEKMILFDVLNERYEKRRPCLLLSNRSVDEVFAYLGERVVDRLREDGGRVIPFNWESHRRG